MRMKECVKVFKLKPYAAERFVHKYSPDRYEYGNGYMKTISKKAKLDAKNANRSIKKSMRQLSKRLIKEQMIEI